MVSGLISYVICSWNGDMYHWPPLWIAPQFFSDIFQGKWSLQVEFNISNSDEREQFSMHSNCLLFLCAFDMPCYVLITLSRCSEVEIIVFGYITGAGLWSCKFAVVWHSNSHWAGSELPEPHSFLTTCTTFKQADCFQLQSLTI